MTHRGQKPQLPPLDKVSTRGAPAVRFRADHTDEDRARWHAQYEALLEDSVPQEEADRIAADLHARGGVQTSRKYRSVATLPFTPEHLENMSQGMAQILAITMTSHIQRLDPKRAAGLWDKFYSWAADDYRTYLAEKDGNAHILDLRTFEAFKRIERERHEKAYEALRSRRDAVAAAVQLPVDVAWPEATCTCDADKDTCKVHGLPVCEDDET